MKNFITILTISLALFVSPIIAQDNPAEIPETATLNEASTPAELEGKDAPKTEEGEGGKEVENPNPIFDYGATSGADSGDTAWMIVATALVLLMTIPGLSLFYGGLTRRKNVLSVLVQCFACAAVMSLLWVIYGYSFATSGDGRFFGDLSVAFLKGVGPDSMSGSIPESVFITFQMEEKVKVNGKMINLMGIL